MEPGDKINILMVDDQPDKLLSYEAMLAELGENLIKASTAKKALDCLLRTDVGLILMDVSMPEIDGFELALMVRQHPRFERTSIIFISAVHVTDLDRLRAYEHGAVDYVSVPVVPDLLRAKVRVFAELFRKTRQLETLNQELRRLSAALLVSQDEERRRIARELHDGLGQELMAAKMMVDGLLREDQTPAWKERSASECSSLLERAMRQVRSVSHLLHPPLLDEVGLASAIDVFLNGFKKRSGIEISINLEPARFPRLDPALEIALFRIVQETFTNIWKHSGARRASIQITKSDEKIALRVSDDGKGMANGTLQLRPADIGIGIGGIVQRIKEFRGEIRLRNTQLGCVVEVILPAIPAGSAGARLPRLSGPEITVTSGGPRRF